MQHSRRLPMHLGPFSIVKSLSLQAHTFFADGLSGVFGSSGDGGRGVYQACSSSNSCLMQSFQKDFKKNSVQFDC